jgi:hypothetical protein
MKIQSYSEFINEAAKYTSDKTHSDFAMYGLYLRNQIHLFHWQTEVGDAHKALGDFYDTFLGKLDEIVEVCMGKHGRVVFTPLATAPLQNLKDINVEEFVKLQYTSMNEYREKVYANDPEIQNLLEEVMAEIQKLSYLLTMS